MWNQVKFIIVGLKLIDKKLNFFVPLRIQKYHQSNPLSVYLNTNQLVKKAFFVYLIFYYLVLSYQDNKYISLFNMVILSARLKAPVTSGVETSLRTISHLIFLVYYSRQSITITITFQWKFSSGKKPVCNDADSFIIDSKTHE